MVTVTWIFMNSDLPEKGITSSSLEGVTSDQLLKIKLSLSPSNQKSDMHLTKKVINQESDDADYCGNC